MVAANACPLSRSQIAWIRVAPRGFAPLSMANQKPRGTMISIGKSFGNVCGTKMKKPETIPSVRLRPTKGKIAAGKCNEEYQLERDYA